MVLLLLLLPLHHMSDILNVDTDHMHLSIVMYMDDNYAVVVVVDMYMHMDVV